MIFQQTRLGLFSNPPSYEKIEIIKLGNLSKVALGQTSSHKFYGKQILHSFTEYRRKY